MKLKDCEIIKLLPLFMRQESDVAALAEVLDPVIRQIGELLPLCSDWENTDELPEDILDELAKELDIDWYKKDETVDVKRNVVKSSDLIHMHMGTAEAVKRVVSDFYGGAVVEEWFEYEGSPGHFRVTVEESGGSMVFPEELYHLIKKVKKASAVMDGVDFNWTNFQEIFFGVAVNSTEKWTLFVDASSEDFEWRAPQTEYAGTGHHQTIFAADIMQSN